MHGKTLAGLVTLAYVLGCAPEAQPGAEASREEPAARPFDPSRIASGDSVLGWRVERVDVRPSAVEADGWVGTVRFVGEGALSGVYRPHHDYPEMDALCFFPDSASAATLPRFPNDQRVSWFCFTNQEAARAQLEDPPATGAATVVIDTFAYHFAHSDVHNQAHLLRVELR